jgi:asparagine synthase (glutamine-hydrolysing)
MCGIVVAYQPRKGRAPYMPTKALAHRGPDGISLDTAESDTARVTMCHTRLAVHATSAVQPLRHGAWTYVVNGEIYTRRDCHGIGDVLHMGVNAPRALDGVFAFVAFHPEHGILAARDPIGVVPMFVGAHEDTIYFASEIKALQHCRWAMMFPPGTVYDGTFHEYRKPYTLPRSLATPLDIRPLLEQAVQKRLNMSVPWGVLLSGGLDSTIVAKCVTQCVRPRGYPAVHTFSIGLEGSPDLAAAAQVARALDTVHHPVVYTVEEGIAAIPAVVAAVETYDVTTIRASVPMYLLARTIRRAGIKVVLSGEGADELFAGYAYNQFAPGDTALFDECVRKLNTLHAYDCARANKSCAAHGVECRVPFLDRQVVDWAMNTLHPSQKLWNVMEKEVLRDAFPDLPAGVSRRKKAQFSDAVGGGWIAACRALPGGEAEYYLNIYDALFPGRRECCLTDRNSRACSSGVAAQWVQHFDADPSGDLIASSTAAEDGSAAS